MPRIAGIDVPDRKKIYYALQYIHGIGPKFARDILAEAKVNPDLRANEVDEQALAQINAIIDANYLVEGALRRQVSQNIQRLKDIRSYRGERHRKGRKKTVAGKKGVKAK